MNANLPATATAYPSDAQSSGLASTLVISVSTGLLLLLSSAAVWAKVEPVLEFVSRYAG